MSIFYQQFIKKHTVFPINKPKDSADEVNFFSTTFINNLTKVLKCDIIGCIRYLKKYTLYS